jgi:hypothetical protein
MVNTRNSLRCVLVCALSALLFVVVSANRVAAQSAGTGALTGTVTDQSGKSVPNATVTITNSGTNQERSTTTGSDGVYKFSLLPPGTYRVKFSAAGFKGAEVSGVVIDVTETPLLDKVLEVGAVTQTVTVESNVETLQTQSSTLGTTVTGSQINALPMAQRNYTEILGLSAGTSGAPENATALGKGTQDISVNGNDPGQNNFQMDGVAIDNIANRGSAGDFGIYAGIGIPNPDAIEEFKVQTSTYDASYGRNPGANVNVVTKSGTNAFHGSAFEFTRDSILNSSDYFYNLTPDQPHQALNQQQFGGSIGGPIKKDKLFFFFSYQGTRSKNGVTALGTTFGAQLPPIPDEPRGTCPAGTGAIATCDTAAQQFAADVAAANCPGNNPGDPQHTVLIAGAEPTCTGSNLNPVALRILQLPGPTKSGFYYPTTNIAGGPSVTPGCSVNGVAGAARVSPQGGPPPAEPSPYYTCNFSIPAIYNEDQYVGNGDYVINGKNTLATRFFYSRNPQITTLNGDLPGTPQSNYYSNINGLLKLTTLVSNNFVNEARISYQRLFAEGAQAVPAGASYANLGMTSSTPSSPSLVQPPFTVIATGNYNIFGTIDPDFSPVNQFQEADQISWSHNKHTIRAGVELEQTQWNLLFQGLERGLLVMGSFNDLLVGQPGNIIQCLFCVTSGPNGIPHHYRLPNLSSFVQDDWKISSKLTLNLGLRWEYDGTLTDTQGNATNIWVSALNQVPNSLVPTTLADALANPALSLAGNVVPKNYAKFYGVPPAGVLTNSNDTAINQHVPLSNFAPRIGLAWQPLDTNKLVVRAGFGIFYDRVALDRFVHSIEQGNPYSVTLDYGYPNGQSLQTPYAAPALVPLPNPPAGVPASYGFAPRYFDADCSTPAFQTCAFPSNNLFPGQPGSSFLSTPLLDADIHTPLIQQYNLGFQYEFAPKWVVEIGYVGSKGVNLVDYNHNINGAQLVSPSGIQENGSISGPGGVDVNVNTVPNVLARVPFLGYQPSGLQITAFDGRSNYNSLQATVRHQFSHGLQVQAAYTWSKVLSDLIGTSANSNDALDLNQQYSPASFNNYQRFIVSYSYDLPFGKGMTGVEGKLVNGWNVSGVTVVQDGNPLTIIDTRNGAAYGTNGTGTDSGFVRAQLCSGATVGDIKTPGGTQANLNNYFNKAAFCVAPDVPNSAVVVGPTGPQDPTGYGDLPNGSVLGPGEFNWDISIIKTTPISEGKVLQFRTEFYNAFNHAQFGNPAGAFSVGSPLELPNVAASNFGIINTSSVNPRIIQFALKFLF